MEGLGWEFDGLLAEAAAGGGEAYSEQFRRVSTEMAELKKRKEWVLGIYRENDQIHRRTQAVSAMLRNISAEIPAWDEGIVHQLLEKVTVLSKDRIRVTFRGGLEMEQEMEYIIMEEAAV